jgi:hypothetical protein
MTVLFTFLVWLLAAASVMAAQPEYIADQQPAPSSVRELTGPLGFALDVPERKPSAFLELKRKLDTLSPFWRDTLLNLRVRSYYFANNEVGGDKDEAWALGGWLRYQSGWWKDRFRLDAVGYTSQRLYGPEDRDGTLLLKPGQEGFAVLGQAYLEALATEDIGFRLYRQAFNLPYINKHDSRMVPNTFEAYTLHGREIYDTSFVLSYIPRMKTRDSDEFRYMSEVAGFEGTKEGLGMAGVIHEFSEDSFVGGINQYAWDLWNTFYTEATGTWDLTNELPIRLSGQFTDQRSVGDELDGDFSTYVASGKVSLSYQGAILSLAGSTTGSGSRIRNPFGGYPGYVSLMIEKFRRAGEDAWLVGLSYDFSFLGIEGLSAFANYANGNTPDSGSNASPDQQEVNLSVDYRIEEGPLKHLWLRFRGAVLDQDGPNAQDEQQLRLILNWDLPIL